jgi:hypothetical protein
VRRTAADDHSQLVTPATGDWQSNRKANGDLVSGDDLAKLPYGSWTPVQDNL